MREVIEAFDHHLAKKGLRFEAVIIGGAALIILEIVDRQTKDVDCLDPTLDPRVKDESIVFATRHPKYRLHSDWLNNGPASLKQELPKGWQSRVQSLFNGRAVFLSTLGRMDLLRSKLYAFCDRQTDLGDCIALRPKLEELRQCYPWVLERDINPLWPNHVLSSLQVLSKKVGYEFIP